MSNNGASGQNIGNRTGSITEVQYPKDSVQAATHRAAVPAAAGPATSAWE